MTKNKIFSILWVVLVNLIPFTSLPLASKILHSEMVAAPSIIPLVLLAIFWFLPNSWKNKLPISSKPIIIFFIVSILISLFAYFLPLPIQKNFNLFTNGVEGIISLLIGISFFLVAAQYIDSEKKLRLTINLIIISFIPLFIWSLLQIIFGQINSEYPQWMVNIQKSITTSGLLFPGRITGFAYEPSWLAHQLNMLYIPIWMGATYSGYSIFHRKFSIFSIENILLILSVLLLFFTKSRIGWLTFFICLGYLLIRFNKQFIFKIRSKYVYLKNDFWKYFLPLIFLFLYLAIIVGGLGILSKIDKRMKNVFDIAAYKNRSVLSIANDFIFVERILYWQTGWNIFNDFPITGVGLGNSGYFFEKYMPSFAWALDEPRDLIFRADYKGNNKNMWTRLLSETGMIGFTIFISWLFLLWSQARILLKNKSKNWYFWGIVGMISLIAFVFESFSIDSFALPYYWLIFGLVSAAFKLSENLKSNNSSIMA